MWEGQLKTPSAVAMWVVKMSSVTGVSERD